LHDIYWKTTEKIVLEADLFPKHGSVANGNHVNPDDFYDQYALHEDHSQNKKNSYLTQFQGELCSQLFSQNTKHTLHKHYQKNKKFLHRTTFELW